MEEAGVGFAIIAKPTDERHVLVSKDGIQYHFGIDYMRDYGTNLLINWM